MMSSIFSLKNSREQLSSSQEEHMNKIIQAASSLKIGLEANEYRITKDNGDGSKFNCNNLQFRN